MKKSIIADIFNGLAGHRETMSMPKEHFENKDSFKIEDELKAKLTPELFALHRKLVDSVESNLCEEIDFYFVEGFKLGLKIGIECMEK